MASLSRCSLRDLCCIRVAYCLWISRVVIAQYRKDVFFYSFVDCVQWDVELLPLPKVLKHRISDLIKPTGKHLISLLSFWISNKLLQNSPEWLTNGMLLECLTLNAYGLINPRKTAKKLLSRMPPDECAFRLACISFLEKEVLKLWAIMREYFLIKIVLQGEKANEFIAEHGRNQDGLTSVELSTSRSFYRDIPQESFWNFFDVLPPFPFTEEPEEVLYWIAFCLSKELSVSMEDIPHFLGEDVDWEGFSQIAAGCDGNVAYFDYYKRYADDDDNEYMAGIFSYSDEIDGRQPIFIFNLLPLNSEEIANLFRKEGKDMMEQFLQWPLSLTFLENPERFWGLLPDEQKREIFDEIYKVLFAEDDSKIPGMYSNDQLFELFGTLWKISSEDYKSLFLCLFDVMGSWSGQQKCCGTSCLKRKLFHLFLSNVEALFDWLGSKNLKKTLKSLVAKYLPEHSKDLKRGCLSFIKKTETKSPEMIEENGSDENESIIVYPNHEKFLEYIQNALISSSIVNHNY